MTTSIQTLTLVSSLSDKERRVYEGNFMQAGRIITALQKYQISRDDILNLSPKEIVNNLLQAEEREALKEVDDNEPNQ